MKSPDLSGWIQRYFQEYLVRQRNVGPATVAAYRDTFKLLLRYLRQKRPRHPDMLSLEILTPETVLGFLHHLEQTRGNTVRTRNARLAAARRYSEALAQARSRRRRRELLDDLFRVLASDQVPDRPGRREPRAIKRRPKPYPRLMCHRHHFREIQHQNRYYANSVFGPKYRKLSKP
jgi:hypothetical protein